MALVKGTDFGFMLARPTASAEPAVASQLYVIDGVCYALKVVAPAGATAITEIGWWRESGTVDANWEGGIYDHDAANDKPGTLLSGASQTNAAGTTNQVWKYATGLNIAITPGTTYWIAVQLDRHSGTSHIVYEQGLSGERIVSTSAEPTTLPAASAFTNANNDASIAFYALYAAASGPSIPVLMNQYRQRRR